jgi:divalent metal cation (Fe/Co/Zn/Cd) transporter
MQRYTSFAKVKGNGAISRPQRFIDFCLKIPAVLMGLVVVFLGIRLPQVTGNLRFDGLALIIIGLILVSVAIWLAIETKRLLIGESANNEVNLEIHNIAASYTGIEQVNG